MVRLSGTNYIKAQANTEANAEAVGIVVSVEGANDFTIQTSGRIATLSGLTAGSVYYLDDDTAGLLTLTEPPDVGDVSKPLLIADTTTSGWIFNMRGFIVSSPPASSVLSYVETTTSDTSITATSDTTAELFVTADEITLDGSTRIEVEFFAPQVAAPGGGGNRFTGIVLFDAVNGGAAASIGILGLVFSVADNRFDVPVRVSRVLTPSAADHEYSIRGYVNGGTGQISCGAGGAGNTMPAYIKVVTG